MCKIIPPARLDTWVTTVVLAGILAISHAGAQAQGTKADYERADALAARTSGKVYKTRVQPHWMAGNNQFWYRNALAEGASEFLLVDAVQGTRQPAFDHAKLAEALGKLLGKPQQSNHLPFDRIVITADGAIHFETGGKAWSFGPKAGMLKEAAMPKAESSTPPSEPVRPRRRPQGSPREEDSPDGKFHVSVKDYDLVLRDRAASKDVPLSYEGAETDAYEPRVFWSPDSKKLVALRTARGDHHVVNLVQSSPSRPASAQARFVRLPQARRSHSRQPAASLRRRHPQGDPDRRRSVSQSLEHRGDSLVARFPAVHFPVQPARAPGSPPRRRRRRDRGTPPRSLTNGARRSSITPTSSTSISSTNRTS